MTSEQFLEIIGENPYKRYRMEYVLDYLDKHNIVGKILFDKLGLSGYDYFLLCIQSDRISKRKIIRLVNFFGIKYKDFVIF